MSIARGRVGLVTGLLLLAAPGRAGAFEFVEGRLQVHGAMSQEFRVVADGYRVRPHNWFMSAMKTKLSVEIEADLFPDGIGPFDIVEGFARFDFSYDCVWEKACHMADQWNYFGDDAGEAPENWATGRTRGVTGVLPNPLAPTVREQPDRELVTVADIDPFSTLLSLGTPEDIAETFAAILPAKMTSVYIRGSLSPITLGLGPINPEFEIDSTGSLKGVTPAVQADLPMRPLLSSLFVPSAGLRRRIDRYDNPDVNFTENELAWDLGASQQQTKFLREAYLDFTMLDGQLVMRLGKQITRWGKTELFRGGTPDQLNPQDFAISNLPSFEESLIALWQARIVASFYEVGPLEDVRLELVLNLDHFEPNDLGDCGEPYTVFLVCAKQGGLLAHGFSGLGIAGERRPPNFWDDGDGLEFSLRLEFRWDRFSFAISNTYGYDDFPTADWFQPYDRNIDPRTGRPRIMGAYGDCVLGTEPGCLTAANAAEYHSGNRQLYDATCRATQNLVVPGPIGALLPISACVISIFNNPDPIPLPIPLPGLESVPALLSSILGNGDTFTQGGVCAGFCHFLGKGTSSPFVLPGQLPFDPLLASIPLHPGLADGVTPADMVVEVGLRGFLSDQQEALLGCGPYYGTDCHLTGVDLFNLEASVFFQRVAQTEHAAIPLAGAIATRFVPGVGTVQLPGARSVFTYFDIADAHREFRWSPVVDGCVIGLDMLAEGPAIRADLIDRGLTPAEADQCNGYRVPIPDGLPPANLATPDFTGPLFTIDQVRMFFPTEMAVVSENVVRMMIGLDAVINPGSSCSSADPLSCEFLNAFFETTAVQRPEIRSGGNGRYGRRDMSWLSGAELDLFYERRNVLGVSVDFAEDHTQTTWGIDFTWIEDAPYANTRADNGYSKEDTLNLTMSIDRPTFINFLNANRTIFFNGQVFLRYIPGYQRRDTFDVDGPFSLLSTLTAFTGFWQDRLMTSVTLIHELESNSGGQVVTMSYRFTESFSLTVGMSAFYGDPSRQRVLDISPVTRFHTADFTQRSNYRGVSAISQRDEIFFNIRRTF